MAAWSQYARPILRIFAAWSAVIVGYWFLGDSLFFVFKHIPPFQWLGQVWIFGSIGPELVYYMGCGALLRSYFPEREWLRIVLVVAFLETFVFMYMIDFFSYVTNFEQKPEFTDDFLFNVIAGRLVPLVAIPLGAFLGKWIADLIERHIMSENLE